MRIIAIPIPNIKMLKTFSDMYCKKKSRMEVHISEKNSMIGLKKYSISDKTSNINILILLSEVIIIYTCKILNNLLI